MISILVNSCDSYHDVLDVFFYGLQDFWPDCPYSIYINSEKKPYNSINISNKIETNVSNEQKWGSRLLNTLNQIKDDYVITLLDDYILEDKVDEDKLNYIVSKIKDRPDISCIYLYYLDSLNMIESEIENLKLVSDDSLYKINTLPAIWRRKDLISIIEKEDDPWSWEAFSMYRKSANGMKIMSVNDPSYNIYNYSALTGGAVYRGKWVKQVVKEKFIRYGLPLNFSKRKYLEENFKVNRSLTWKVNFLSKGYQIARIKVFIFIFKSFKSKWY